MNRRAMLGALGSAAFTGALAQEPRFGISAAKRTAPMLCVFSQNLARIPYAQLGDIARDIGYEGVDLTVMIGGHVDPRVTNVDLVRAFESVRGSGLEVPMISTNITTANDPTAYPVMYLTGHSQIPLFRLGFWPYNDNVDIRQRLTQARLDLAQVAILAQRCGISALFPNRAGGFIGQSVWDAHTVISGMDARWIGYDFDPAEAMIEGGAGGWESALRLALPRLKAISLQDFYWRKDGDSWKAQKCPLGEGMVDWQRFFSIVSAAKFTGPVSLHLDYETKSNAGAMAKDLEFARGLVQKAWANPGSGS